jgi:hypothetical protein
LQGEGQEFESPRLHHLPPARASRAPLIRVLSPEATDQRIAGGLATLSRTSRCAARTLPTGIVIGRMRSLFEIFDFAVLSVNSDTSIPSARDRWVRTLRGSSYTGHEVDALAPRADEGRGRLRKAPGSREQTSIRRCPNGETRLEKSSSPLVESNRPGGGKPAN